ncbi:MAG TPA: indolepyruvate oxidoreductase subunit beta [Acidobacteriota bacterium]|nr:indolepyruvate oxidoreductase subunit beta [Acidobacteriota bacterium]
MKFDMVVAGVGGQGILSISFVVDNAALAQGLHFKQSEVHGMAQRGGAVVSHLRISDSEIFSDLVSHGSADLVLSMEPVEALRYRQFLSPDGWLIASTNPFINIPNYPEEEKTLEQVRSVDNHVVVNSAELARAAGSHHAQNMVMLGAAGHLLPLENKHIEQFIGVLFRAKGDKVIEANLTAFSYGRLAGSLYRDLLAAGLASADADAVATHLLPWDYSREDVKGWIELCRADGSGELRSWLRTHQGLINGDAATRKRLASIDLNANSKEDLEALISKTG